jgi:hypothetical protein
MELTSEAATAEALGNETSTVDSSMPEQVATTAEANQNAAEADAAFLELQEAARSGNELVAQLRGEGVDIPAVASKDGMTPEQKQADDEIRRKRNSANATTQRTRGLAELNKTYTNTVQMPLQMKLNDVSVASVAVRFLGQIDKAYFVIGRRGRFAIGAAKTEDVIERLDAQIDEFYKESQDERAQVKLLMDVEVEKFKNENVDDEDIWLTPAYQTAAIELTVHLKHPQAVKFLKGFKNFDALIHDLTVLQWNGVVEKSRVEQIRLRQNRLAHKVFMFSISAVNGMYNKLGQAK